MEQASKGLRYQSRTYPKLETLMNRVNEVSIKEQHRRQSAKKASGIDRVTKAEYGEELEQNVTVLMERMRAFSYKPQPVRRAYIAKGNGKQRPLGIPAYEDRLVQGVMADILSEIYEERFVSSSYGFRPKRNAHDVLHEINQTIMIKRVNYVLEADIKGFFDNVDHGWLMRFLEHDIADKNFLRYVKRFLNAGVMEGTEYQESERGTPQGGQISPVLANVYLHYALDVWVEKLRKVARGEVYYVRYADDFLLMFQYENEARAALSKLRERLAKFNLELAEEKTRILPMGRYKGTKEGFDFLGFTFYNTHTRGGKYRLGIRTSKSRLKTKRGKVKAWLRTRLTAPVWQTMEKIAQSLAGHMNYYGVNGNLRALQGFWKYVKYTCYRMLNRRSQKRSMRAEVFERIWRYYVRRPRLTKDIWNWKPMLV